jgi:pyridoxal phosphate enzyme (YggS family)
MIALTRIAKNVRELKAECKKTVLVAVTKYSPLEDVLMAFEAGVADFGENRTTDLLEKSLAFHEKNLENVRWHFIGHLQSNKVKELYKVPNLWAVHSVDSMRLLEEMFKREGEFRGPELKIFLQVKTTEEAEKAGFESLEELAEAVVLLNSKKDSKLKFHGLMTMGSIRTENFEVDARKSFQALKKVRDSLSDKYHLRDLKLSMGMSQDYQIALQEGADYIRVGSLIFK